MTGLEFVDTDGQRLGKFEDPTSDAECLAPLSGPFNSVPWLSTARLCIFAALFGSWSSAIFLFCTAAFVQGNFCAEKNRQYIATVSRELDVKN